MKAKEKDAKRSLTEVELRAELHTTREKLFKLRFKHKVTPLANPIELRDLRRHIARLETWIGEKSRATKEQPA